MSRNGGCYGYNTLKSELMTSRPSALRHTNTSTVFDYIEVSLVTNFFNNCTVSYMRQQTMYDDILFIDDIDRTSYWPAKELFYDLLSLPLSQVLGKEVKPSVRMQSMRNGKIQNLKAYDLDNEKAFSSKYLNLSNWSKKMYDEHVDVHKLCFSYEASPALTNYLQQNNVSYVDFRLAPLRFLPDLLIAVKSNDMRIQQGLAQCGVSLAEIKLCANELKASYRYKQRYIEFAPIPHSHYYFVGQTPNDNSIIDGGYHLRIANRKSELETYFFNKTVMYLPHPAAPAEHVQQEIALLEQIASSVELSNSNSYDLLCEESNDLFVSISSGLLQEAQFFGKQSISLLAPICPLGYSDQSVAEDVYYLLDYDTFTDKNFLNFLLGNVGDFERTPLRKITSNKLRRLHDVWYAYAGHRLHQDEMQRDLRESVAQTIKCNEQSARSLHRVLSHLVSSLSKRQFLQRLNKKIHQQKWKWPDAQMVEIRSDYQVFKNHAAAGRWYKTIDRNHFIIFWNQNSELNTLEYKPYSNELHFIDSTNETFVAYAFECS